MKVFGVKIGLEPPSILGGIVALVVIPGVVALAPRLLRSTAKFVIKTGIRVHRAWTQAPATRRVGEGRKRTAVSAGRARISSAPLTAERQKAYEQFADFVAALSRRSDLDKARKGQMIHDRARELKLLS
ncbi:MAG TPA: hypothetical protein VMU60_04635 [Syntrophobacteria bacterium]|nr:hypothetical protein [Syntrophobacteria bacterium]